MTEKKDTIQFTATIEGGKAKVTYPEAAFSRPGEAALPVKQITLADFPDSEDSGWRWAPWGRDDMRPTRLRQQIEAVPMAGAALDKLVKMMYGNGIVYVKKSDLAKGDTDVPRAYDPRVEAFMQRNRINTMWYLAQCWDYRYYVLSFTEYALNNAGDEIVGMYHKAAEHCRFSRQDEKDFKIKFVGYSPRFAEAPPSQDKIIWMPLYRWDEHDEFFQKLKGRRFAAVSYLPMPGMLYYPKAPWIGLFKEKGWLKVSADVPNIVNAMQQNQIALKYIINVSVEYFRIRHRDWDMYTAEQQEAEFKAFSTKIETHLSGTDNVFKSITVMFEEDPITGNRRGLVEVVAVDDKTKVGTWVPSSATADAQIVQGFGLHPSQVGLSQDGGSMGAGSGSDQRESFNTAIGLNTPEQHIILEQLNFVFDYNGWPYRALIDHTTHTTTNAQESGLQPSPTSVTLSPAKK